MDIQDSIDYADPEFRRSLAEHISREKRRRNLKNAAIADDMDEKTVRNYMDASYLVDTIDRLDVSVVKRILTNIKSSFENLLEFHNERVAGLHVNAANGNTNSGGVSMQSAAVDRSVVNNISGGTFNNCPAIGSTFNGAVSFSTTSNEK